MRKILFFILLCLCASHVAQAQQPYNTKILNGSSWLNGNGVDVYSNGSTGNVTYDYSAPAVGMKWQCVEVCQRFYKARGWYSGIFPNVDYAYQIYDAAPNMGMQHHDNNTGYVPVPGDMIVFSGGTAGHVSVVDHVDSNYVYVVEQNWNNSTGKSTLSLNGSQIGNHDSNHPVRGIVHSPNNPYTNAPSTDLYVSMSGSDNNAGTSGSPFATVTKAVSAASDTAPTVIHVKGGRYKITSSLTIHKNIRIVNDGGGVVYVGK